jgi:DNA mismatch repair protein MutS2
MVAMTPSPLEHDSARVLEFDLFRDLLRGYAFSPLGQARVAALAPSADRAWIERQQQLAAEVREYLRGGARFDFSNLLDPAALLAKSRIQGAALETGELRDILLVVDRAAEWREIALHPPGTMKTGWPAVAELSASIADFAALRRFFANKILPDGTLDDRASPELARIRREIEKQRRAIQESLRGYLRRLGEAVQDELITIRGERFVIPVKAEQKRRIQGVVHGASSSGQTVFVEPLETIEQNNEMMRLLEEEQAEIHRILLEMTRRIGEQADEIAAAVAALAELELQFAKARFAEDYGCVAATIGEGDGAALHLYRARHPLLERTLRGKGGRVVPISIELGGDHAQLVISGPNTGGKTVALKTIGLLAVLAQAGVPLPAERATLPLFDAVLADIGEYQSIEQNLSTFSAHVTNIDFISKTATGHSLVLLDELGSATDPEEGAALAVAIADHFRRLGALTVISTHHTALKVYAANVSGVLNAAVGFDDRTLLPTYELHVGVPGPSAGINIAQRLGLNPEIIDSARARLGSQAQDVARFLDRLHEELSAAEAERQSLRAREQEVARERSRLDAEGLKEQRARLREMEKKVEAVIRDFEYRAREVIAVLQDRVSAQKLSKEAERRIARLRREFKEEFDQAVVAHSTGADRGDPNARPAVVRQVAEGDTVKLKSLGRNAVVKRAIGDDTFEVEAGAMKMRIPRDDIAEVVARAADSPVAAARARGFAVHVAEESSVPGEINVIGQSVDDATREVDKYLDRAFLAGMARVRIVHGSGMGILRKALRAYLQQHPHVASIAEPRQQEGGAGATVVDLKV